VNAIWENPLLLLVIGAIPSFILGYLGYRRSVRVDKVTEQSGAASNELEAVGQVIDGLNKLVANLQEDNKHLREDVTALRARLKEIETAIDKATKELSDAKQLYELAAARIEELEHQLRPVQ
jgi:chromosome segregation ATPase